MTPSEAAIVPGYKPWTDVVADEREYMVGFRAYKAGEPFMGESEHDGFGWRDAELAAYRRGEIRAITKGERDGR